MPERNITLLKKKLKKEVLILIIVVAIVLVIASYVLFLFFNFRSGEIVFVQSGEEAKVGIIEGVSLFNFGYLIRWSDGTYGEESFFNLNRIEDTEDEIILFEKNTNKTGFIYPVIEDSGKLNVFIGNVSNEEYLESMDLFTDIPLRGMGYNITIRKKPLCNPLFVCEDWSDCEAKYGLYEVVNQKNVSGFKYRYCKDGHGCLSNFVEAKECSRKIPIQVKKVYWCNEEYLELYDGKNLIARMKTPQNKTTLDISFIVVGEGYCNYCHDGSMNYDEEGIDCGGSCEKCQ